MVINLTFSELDIFHKIDIYNVYKGSKRINVSMPLTAVKEFEAARNAIIHHYELVKYCMKHELQGRYLTSMQRPNCIIL